MLLIALMTLVEYLLEVDLGIDERLFQDPDTPDWFFPGRMARETGVAFVAAGLALFLALHAPRLGLPARALAVGIAAFGVLGVLAYLLKFARAAVPHRRRTSPVKDG